MEKDYKAQWRASGMMSLVVPTPGFDIENANSSLFSCSP
jgi:hypothetical protein